ncbi:hypothetical protein OROMI_009472 [Orobanche minor]
MLGLPARRTAFLVLVRGGGGKGRRATIQPGNRLRAGVATKREFEVKLFESSRGDLSVYGDMGQKKWETENCVKFEKETFEIEGVCRELPVVVVSGLKDF